MANQIHEELEIWLTISKVLFCTLPFHPKSACISIHWRWQCIRIYFTWSPSQILIGSGMRLTPACHTVPISLRRYCGPPSRGAAGQHSPSVLHTHETLPLDAVPLCNHQRTLRPHPLKVEGSQECAEGTSRRDRWGARGGKGYWSPSQLFTHASSSCAIFLQSTTWAAIYTLIFTARAKPFKGCAY